MFALIVVAVLASGTKEVNLETFSTEIICESAKNKLNNKFSSIKEVSFKCEKT